MKQKWIIFIFLDFLKREFVLLWKFSLIRQKSYTNAFIKQGLEAEATLWRGEEKPWVRYPELLPLRLLTG